MVGGLSTYVGKNPVGLILKFVHFLANAIVDGIPCEFIREQVGWGCPRKGASRDLAMPIEEPFAGETSSSSKANPLTLNLFIIGMGGG